MRAVIVDDSPIDRLNLRTLLQEIHEVEIAGEAGSLASGRTLIEGEQPDVVFLDVCLSRETGFQLLESLTGKPRVIFTTLHREYAFPAFEVEAVDFLLKPLTLDRLRRSIQRIAPSIHPAGPSALDPSDLLVFKQGDERRVFEVERILAVVGNRDYTRILAAPRLERLDDRRMRDWQELLPPHFFQPLDRSTIVNIRQISSYRPTSGGGLVAFRNHPTPLPIGHTAFRRLETILHPRAASVS